MGETDFSKVGELFFEEVGTRPKEIALQQFVEHALHAYQKEQLAVGDFTTKQVTYGNPATQTHLSFLVSASRGQPAIFGLQLAGMGNAFAAFFDPLQGYLTAEYTGLPFPEVDETLAPRILQSLGEQQAQGNMHSAFVGSLHLSLTPELSITKAALEHRKRKLLGREIVPVRLEDAVLDESARALLASAQRVSVSNSFYRRQNPHDELIQESCDITQPVRGTYQVTYRVQSAAGNALPPEAFPRAEKIFDAIKHGLDATAYGTMKTINPEIWVRGVDAHG
ncbi:hypothetical protein HYS48_02700 [Candidatus Woesearchaeota archaeon]|nr:hypothetical protein [Candidatus Woesearchaeota archaeon]